MATQPTEVSTTPLFGGGEVPPSMDGDFTTFNSIPMNTSAGSLALGAPDSDMKQFMTDYGLSFPAAPQAEAPPLPLAVEGISGPDNSAQSQKLKIKLKLIGGENAAPDAENAAAEESGASENRWVQCEHASCNKWRVVPPHVDMNAFPPQWFCSMNDWDPQYASCDVPEEVVEKKKKRKEKVPKENVDNSNKIPLKDRPKPFVCEKCGKGFTTKPGIKYHVSKSKKCGDGSGADDGYSSSGDVITDGEPPRKKKRRFSENSVAPATTPAVAAPTVADDEALIDSIIESSSSAPPPPPLPSIPAPLPAMM
jgi:hypothetical protein